MHLRNKKKSPKYVHAHTKKKRSDDDAVKSVKTGANQSSAREGAAGTEVRTFNRPPGFSQALTRTALPNYRRLFVYPDFASLECL